MQGVWPIYNTKIQLSTTLLHAALTHSDHSFPFMAAEIESRMKQATEY